MSTMTKKELNDLAESLGKIVVCNGYCTLKYQIPVGDLIAYNRGVYGWNWSAYDAGPYIVVDSYRNTAQQWHENARAAGLC